MTTAPISFRDRFLRTGLSTRRRRIAALCVLVAGGAVAASIYVYSVVCGAPAPLLAGLGHRSYRPGQVALLRIGGGAATSAKLQIFLAGASGGDAPVSAKPGWDKHTFGEAVTTPRLVRRPTGGAPWTVPIHLARTGRAATTSRASPGPATAPTPRSSSARSGSARRPCS